MRNKYIVPGVLLFVSGAALLGAWMLQDDTVDTPDSSVESASQSQVDSDPIAVAIPSDYLGDYEISDETYGTMTSVVVDAAAGTRTITSNALPNHDTGQFPNNGNPNAISAQSVSYAYPLVAELTGQVSEPRTVGVAVNGVKFEPGTAETFTCTSGERYRVEAIQDFVSLGLDFNNAHVQPTGEYHYHGQSSELVSIYDTDQDLVHVGFAADGHLMYYSKSGAYDTSYQIGSGVRSGEGCEFSLPTSDVEFGITKDGSITSDWEYVEGLGDLDECNGAMIGGAYAYLLTDSYPFIGRCLKGDAGQDASGPPPTTGSQPPVGGPQG